MTGKRYLVTGSQGCIGAWVIKNLLERGDFVIAFDLETEPRRLVQILELQAVQGLTYLRADVRDRAALLDAVAANQITHIIHLAALQVPACQADPLQGALVNVAGTLNVFEAAAVHHLECVVYASSAAVAGAPEDYDTETFTADSVLQPHTHYGVFKQCNEGNAAVYFESKGVHSIGLRPWAVYGVGRDFGLTSDPTKAMKAAVLERPFEIQFGGRANMQYVDDVARIFIASADSGLSGARVYNLRGKVLDVQQIISVIESVVPAARGLIGHRQNQLPIVPDFDDQDLRRDLASVPSTPFETGVRRTVEIFKRLLREDRLPTQELEAAVLSSA